MLICNKAEENQFYLGTINDKCLRKQVLSYNEAEKDYRSDRRSSKEFCVTITEQRWACLAQSRDRDKEAIRLTEMPRSLFGNYTRLIQYAPLKVCHIVLIQVRCHKM